MAFYQSMIRQAIVALVHLQQELRVFPLMVPPPASADILECRVQLLRQYSNVNKILVNGEWGRKGNLMHIAADLEEAECLIENGFDDFHRENSEGLLPVVTLSHDIELVRFCLRNGTDVNYQDGRGRPLIFSLLANVARTRDSLSYAVHGEESRNRLRGLRIFLTKGANPFLADNCRCPCAPSGCSSAAVFRLCSHPGNRPETTALEVIEWLSIIDEFYGQEEARAVLLSLVRRLKFDEMDMTHVCCHGGRGLSGRFCKTKSGASKGGTLKAKDKTVEDGISEEDRNEILEEEVEFIQLLDEEMDALSFKSFAELQHQCLHLLSARYHQLAWPERSNGINGNRQLVRNEFRRCTSMLECSWHAYNANKSNNSTDSTRRHTTTVFGFPGSRAMILAPFKSWISSAITARVWKPRTCSRSSHIQWRSLQKIGITCG